MDYVTVVTVDEKLNSIDCSNFDGSTFKKNKIIKIADEDVSQFVTVVSVGNNHNNNNKFSSVNDKNNNSVCNNSKSDIDKVELVTVYRLPGERIGLGLKFQGGAKSKENIERLFIQSCAVESPASRVKTAWGHLNEGDEILQIDGIPVYKLTRLECVKCLKESNVAINFLIKNTKFKLSELNENGVKAPPTPPPIPPRKLHKKRVENSLESLVQPIITIKSNSMSGENSPTTESNIDFGETESDDTGSTISTVIDKFSSYQNFTENDEITNHKDTESKLDKILNTFTMLEKEFAGNEKPITVQESQMNDLNNTSPHGPPPPIKSRTIIDEKENINPRMETKIVNNKIHPKEPPIPPPRNIIKVEQTKTSNRMEPEKLPNCDKSAQQFTTIHNWLQDTSDVIHECAIFIDENDNEFNSELYNKQLSDENNLNAESDTDNSCVKSENVKNLINNSNNTNNNTNNNNSGNNSNSTSSDDDNDDNLGPFDKMDYTGASEAYFNAHWGPTLLPTIGEVDEEFPSLEPQISAVTEIIINDMDDKENQMNTSNHKNNNNSNSNEQIISTANGNNSNELTVANQNKLNLFKNEITEIKINYENVNPNCDKLNCNKNNNNNNSRNNNGSDSDIINNNLNNNNNNNNSIDEKIEEINVATNMKQEINNQLIRDDDHHDTSVPDVDKNSVANTTADVDDDVDRHVVDGSSCSSERQENGVLNKNENCDAAPNKQMSNSESENSNHMDHQKNHIIKCASNNDNEKILSISPPTFSRMPPDGDEFPPNFNESIIVNGGSDVKSYNKMKLLNDENSSVMHQPPPPPLPKSSQPIVLTSKSGGTKTYQMYRQDFVIQIDDVRNNPATASSTATGKNSVPIIIEDKVIRKKENLIKATLPAVLPLNDNATTNNTNHKNNVNNHNKIISNNSNHHNKTNLLADTVDMPLKSTPKTPNSFNSVVASKIDWSSTNKYDNSGIKPSIQLRNWREDEKSLKSVRDKIAMFSSPGSENGGGAVGTIVNRRSSITMKSAENLSVLTSMPTTPTTMPSLNGSFASIKSNSFTKNRAMSVENLNDKTSYSSPPFIPMTPPSSATASLNYNRSKSVTNSLPRNSSVTPGRHSILTRATSFNDSTGSLLDNDTERKQKINTILEQRKKSISKLRGLVIPEKRSIDSDEILKPVLLDLPEIKNIEIEKIKSINKSIISSSNGKENNNNTNNNHSWIRDTKKESTKLSSGHHQSPAIGGGNITTNSLEYKRIFNNTNRPTLHSFVSKQQNQAPIKPPRTSLIINTRSYEKLNTRLDYESELSDSVSQFSSQKSSPPLSPQSKYPLTRTLSSETNTSIASSTSTLTSGSGSQASCSSLGSSIQTVDMSRRIQKSSNNETLTNRKSILALARCRNGRGDCKNSDGDSTDGYEEIEYAKSKQSKKSTSLNGGDKSIVDKIIKVASYIEVMTDSEGDSEPENIMKIIPTEAKSITMHTTPPPPPLVATSPVVTSPPVKLTKDYQKQKVSAAEIRKAFEDKNKAHQLATKTAEMKRYNSAKPKVDEMKTAPPPPPVRQSSLNENSNKNIESVAIKTSVSKPMSSPPPTPVKEEVPMTVTSSRREDIKFENDEIRMLVTEAEPPLETPDYLVIELKRETPESSIGITLAGGSDYEAKEITIHRILKDSPADKDGRLKKGDRVLGINGLTMKGLTHGESISILKAPRTEVILVITRSKSVVIKPLAKSKRPSLGSLSSINDSMSNTTSANSTPSKELASPTSKIEKIITTPVDVTPPSVSPVKAISNRQKTDKNVTINKDGCGLGFSIEGGYDSPNGNIPLLVKKVFMGGAAEKSGQIRVGDEITAINDLSTLNLTRVDVWNLMKKLPQGPVKLTLRLKNETF